MYDPSILSTAFLNMTLSTESGSKTFTKQKFGPLCRRHVQATVF